MLLVLLGALVVSSFVGQGLRPLVYLLGVAAWTVVDFWLAIYALRNREEFLRVERDSLFIQTEMELERSQKESSTPEGVRSRRERSVVMRALLDWCARPDKPYMKDGLTIMDVASATDIPPAVLYRYGSASFGLTFEEYIAYLREKDVSGK